MKMRVADYVTDTLYNAGGEHVFLITGGMIMHLTDALLQHGRQKYVCCHHEQAAVMAAEAYGRYTGRLGVAYVTAGPGALNTLTGVVGAYVDSSPCIIVAGQSKVSQAKVTGPRQFALQGFNTLPIFRNVTKYAVMLDDVSRVRYEMEKCIYISKTHRVGPVWIELPIDISGASFDPEKYEGFTVPRPDPATARRLEKQAEVVARAIRASHRPCVLGGAGIRLSGAIPEFRQFIESAGIPAVTARLGMDLLGYDHPLYIGHPGTYGDRPANFTVQNCDLLLTVGSRMGIGLTGHDFHDFAPQALKIMVDIDLAELSKPSVVPDISVQADAKEFLTLLNKKLGDYRLSNKKWVDQTRLWKRKYPVDLPEYDDDSHGINSYRFMSLLSDRTPSDAIFLVDTGSCFHVFAQAFRVRDGQRHIITGGLSTMGYMPASIGVATANKGKDVYCITGDGSLQMNIQELETIAYNKLPVKLIVLSNKGYLLIRLTQTNFQGGRFIGTDESHGVGLPDLEKIACAYGIKYVRIASLADISPKLDEMFAHEGPVMCEVISPANQVLIPRVSSKQLPDGSMVSMPYDDMFPFLPPDEYEAMKDIGDGLKPVLNAREK
jgi:acetolactate synthase-1/2/3 large subunit